jgi:hypothetical protein
LDSIEYTVRLLKEEVESYAELVDKELLIPKFKFVKERLQRLMNRMKFSRNEVLACVGIRISIIGNVDRAEVSSLLGYLIDYIDNHIRPGDTLFKIDNNTMGIILILKDKADLEKVFNRLSLTLLNFKTKTYSDKNVLLNFNMDKFVIHSEDSVDQVIEKIENLGKGEDSNSPSTQ